MKKLMGLLALALIMILAACSSDEASSSANESEAPAADAVPQDLAFGSATVGGFWYTLSAGMADKMAPLYPDSSVTIVEGGSVSNLLGLDKGTFALGFANGQTVPEALEGKNAFKEPVENVSTVATLYPNVFHMVVREDSDIHSLEDLKGKTVSPGIAGYSGELAFQDMLEVAGMSYDDLGGIEYIGTADGADLLRDGHIDAIVGMVAAPLSTFEELDTTVGIRLLPLEDDMVASLNEMNEGYLPYTIEGGTYSNITEDINTVAGYTVLLVNNDLMGEDSVYELTKMIFENQEHWTTLSTIMNDFSPEYSVENNVGNLHPGAEKYYKEVGALE
ncbi:TAXI family TRAP transporter solute-binding subunit [Planococcus salinus]|uniref:TAXI family TRAP transporter solute-binding subunit n=1 Tax=Planococcus salinus TaxID=1848460 RepID=A0A3M8P987_9BACL|nr:TAXI family TRAP transporter solute-binding subunit [Planococcus salinus]RNF40213.1 TAXI family TRAP transporter solute-binding subunit [Planococcus salinus]